MRISHLPLASLFALTVLAFTLTACGGSASENPAVISGSTDVNRLRIVETTEGSGATATVGHTVSIQYSGWLYTVNADDFKGEMFDSNVGGSPFDFALGSSEVITGLNQGVVGMRVGGERTLIIPSGLAYGRQGNGPIPPNAAVVFDVELVDVN